MAVKALFAYLHYLSFLIVVSTLVLELVMFRPVLSKRDIKVIRRADGLYGLGAILVVVTGLLRAFYFEKGSGYYFSNYIFLTKLGLFTAVGLLSIYPTRRFAKFIKQVSEDHFDVPDLEFRRIRGMITAEVVLVFLIPLLAALMARGYGF